MTKTKLSWMDGQLTRYQKKKVTLLVHNEISEELGK